MRSMFQILAVCTGIAGMAFSLFAYMNGETDISVGFLAVTALAIIAENIRA